MTEQSHSANNRQERGQSLVELALFFPILLLLVAGLIEVSNLLITKNRIETAARAAARFAAAGGKDVHTVALNSVTDTLDLSSGVWDIWTIKAQVNEAGDDFNSWDVVHTYGLSNTTVFTDVAATLTATLPSQVLYELQTNELGIHVEPDAADENTQIAADLEVVGVLIVHDINSILGLNAFPALAGITSVQALSVMRTKTLTAVDQTDGCQTAFPIAVDRGTRSLRESEYPTAAEFTYPPSPPPYLNFFNNEPEQELDEAEEGYIFRFSRSTFRLVWPKWNSGISGGSTTLANSLIWPGNVFDYSNHGDPGTSFNPPGYVIRGFVEVGDATDLSLHVGDRLSANETASLSDAAVQAQLQDHIDKERGLRFIVLPAGGGAPQFLPGYGAYHTVDDLAIFRLHGYSVGGDWILAEFINWDKSCGQTPLS
jgi:hypothetical protein